MKEVENERMSERATSERTNVHRYVLVSAKQRYVRMNKRTNRQTDERTNALMEGRTNE